MEPSPLVYDTAAAAAVWQRVGPALPAYDAAPCPAGACCRCRGRETDQRGDAGRADRRGRGVVCLLPPVCRPCAPAESARRWNSWPGKEQRAVRALLAAYFLHTGRWRQPPRRRRGYGRRGWRPCGGCMWARRWCSGAVPIWRRAWRTAVAAAAGGEADRAAERGKRLANLLEKALTTENNLLKW